MKPTKTSTVPLLTLTTSPGQHTAYRSKGSTGMKFIIKKFCNIPPTKQVRKITNYTTVDNESINQSCCTQNLHRKNTKRNHNI